MTPTFEAVERLAAALDGLSGALESGRPDAVVAAEAPLAAAVSALESVRRNDRALDTAAERARMLKRLRDAQGTLSRCRALGDAAASLTAVMFATPMSYGRTGAMRVGPPDISHSLNSRT